ncbi:MAG: hypothetical protein LBD94_02380, partial [Rickettsiales bacterium]|nr:hypothetical protein [Rickettsiales bacterium]
FRNFIRYAIDFLANFAWAAIAIFFSAYTAGRMLFKRQHSRENRKNQNFNLNHFLLRVSFGYCKNNPPALQDISAGSPAKKLSLARMAFF